MSTATDTPQTTTDTSPPSSPPDQTSSGQQDPTDADLGETHALMLIVEPLADKGHIRFKVTYHYYGPDGEPVSDVEFHRGQFRTCEAINTRLLGATASATHAFNLQRVKADSLPKYEPPEEDLATASPATPRLAHPEVDENAPPPLATIPTLPESVTPVMTVPAPSDQPAAVTS